MGSILVAVPVAGYFIFGWPGVLASALAIAAFIYLDNL